MTLPIVLTVGFLGIAGLLRALGRLRSDLVALLLLAAFGLARLLPSSDLFSGFSRSAVILIIAIYLIAAGLEDTGALRLIARVGLRRAARGGRRAVFWVMVVAACLSLGLNTVVVVALLMPSVVALAHQSRVATSRLLLPLSLGALLGGMATLFTTANLLVSAALVDRGIAPLSVLDLFPGGAVIALVGIMFVTLIGYPLLPDTPERHPLPTYPGTGLTERYDLPGQVKAFYVGPTSSLAGVSFERGAWSRVLGLTVVGLSRGDVTRLAPPPGEVVRIGDIVFAIGAPEAEALAQYGLFPTADPSWPGRLASATIQLVEAVPVPWSTALGKSLRELAFRERFGLNVVAIWQAGRALRTDLADRPLEHGDTLLLQGQRDRINALRRDPDYIVLEEGAEEIPISWRAWAALGLTLAALLLPASGLLPIAEAAFSAAAMMVLLGCTTIERGYRAVDWKTVFTVAAILPISLVLTGTGTADWIGHGLAALFGQSGALGIAAVVFVLSVALTQIVGGRVTAILVAPIAIATAVQFGADPRWLVMVVAWGCSSAFLRPNAHPAQRLILGPGGYSVRDFVRIGLPLTFVTFLTVLIVALI